MRWVKRAALLALAAGALFLVDRRWRSGPAYTAEWLSAGDVKVRALRAGRGDTTLLFLHGYVESLLAWRAQVDHYRGRYRVVAVDVPGFGESDKPVGPYTLSAQEQRLSAFLDRWTDGPVIVVGHSMGGELAADLALQRSDRVIALALVAPAGWGLAAHLDSLRPGTIAAIGWASAIAGSSLLPIHDPNWLAEPEARLAYDPLGDPAYRAAAAAVMHDFDFAALADSAPDIRQPVLLIWGREDPTIPFAVGERLASLLPCVTFEPLGRTLHRPHETDPDTVNSLIDAFLRHPTCGHPGP